MYLEIGRLQPNFANLNLVFSQNRSHFKSSFILWFLNTDKRVKKARLRLEFPACVHLEIQERTLTRIWNITSGKILKYQFIFTLFSNLGKSIKARNFCRQTCGSITAGSLRVGRPYRLLWRNAMKKTASKNTHDVQRYLQSIYKILLVRGKNSEWVW